MDIQGDPPGPDRDYWTRVTVARAAVRLGALTDPGLLANLSTDREVRRHGRALLPAARLHADLTSYTEEARAEAPPASDSPAVAKFGDAFRPEPPTQHEREEKARD